MGWRAFRLWNSGGCREWAARGRWGDPDARLVPALHRLSALGTLTHLSFIRSLSSTSRECPAPRTRHRPAEVPPPPRRWTLGDIRRAYARRVPICVVTAYNYPQAVHADLAEMDIVLVGDSVGMVELGYPTTQFVTLEQMLHHAQAVARGCHRALIVADMPFGSYEVSVADAMRNVMRMIREGHVQAVKMEGGRRIAATVRACVQQAGVAVMGHCGLLPQTVSALGGFRSYGKNAAEAQACLEDALALQDAGAFSVVLECVPERLARAITAALEVPTIGIGAGAGTSGQVLVYHDLCGLLSHPHHAKVTPKFCKRFARAGEVIQEALERYRDEVKHGAFPAAEHSPYSIPDREWERFATVYEKLTGQSADAADSPTTTLSAEVPAAAAGVEKNTTVANEEERDTEEVLYPR